MKTALSVTGGYQEGLRKRREIPIRFLLAAQCFSGEHRWGSTGVTVGEHRCGGAPVSDLPKSTNFLQRPANVGRMTSKCGRWGSHLYLWCVQMNCCRDPQGDSR